MMSNPIPDNPFAAVAAECARALSGTSPNSLVSLFPPSAATALNAHATVSAMTGSPVVMDTPAAVATASQTDTNANDSFVDGAQRATCANEFALTTAAAVIHPKCMATGRWTHTYVAMVIGFDAEDAINAPCAPPSAAASALRSAAGSQKCCTRLAHGRNAAHHSDCNPHTPANHGAADANMPEATGFEAVNPGAAAIAASALSPRKMGPQIANAQPAGDTKPRDQCARGMPAGSVGSFAASVIFAAILAAIARLASAAISPSTRPGTATETTFTANAPAVSNCQPFIPNAGIEESQPDAVSFTSPTARPPAAVTIAPTAASRAPSMVRKAVTWHTGTFIGGAERNSGAQKFSVPLKRYHCSPRTSLAMPAAPRATRAKWFSWTSAIAVGAAVGAGAFVYYLNLLEPPKRRRVGDEIDASRGTTEEPSVSPASPGASSAVGTPQRTENTPSPAPQSPRLSKKQRQKLAVSRAQSELLGSLESANAFGKEEVREGDGSFDGGIQSVDPATLDQRFKRASAKVEHIVRRITTSDKLQIYGLYKQATCGPCVDKKPRLLEGMQKHAKWTAWSELLDLASSDAKREYVELVGRLCGEQGGVGEAGAAVKSESDQETSDTDDGTLGGPVFSRPERPFDAPSGETSLLTPLAEACRAGDVDAIQKIFKSASDSGVDMQRDDEGRTALHWAADGGHALAAQTLLECMKKQSTSEICEFVDAVDDEGQTASHYAATVESAGTCRVLIKWGADVTVEDADGETPAELGAKELAERGAELEARV